MHADEKQMIEKTHNTARFFTEQRHISWVLLVAVVLWGVYGYLNMPKRKDPEVPVRLAVALTPWPGVSAEKVEDLVTRQLETKVAGNAKVKKIESISRTGLLAFQERFSNLAQPFAWKFTRDHLRRWLNKLSAQPLAA